MLRPSEPHETATRFTTSSLTRPTRAFPPFPLRLDSIARTAVLCALPLFAACAESSAPQPDVLLVTIDTLRSDFLSTYGYPRKSTPNLDALADQGAVFENHYTTIATTAPAHATLFTGLFAREHGLTKNGQSLSAELTNLPNIFREHGYRTAASIGASILGSKHGFATGFDDFDEDFGESVLRPSGKSGKYERYAQSVVDRAISLAQKPGDRPLFLWVHLYDPHEPYAPPIASPLKPEDNLAFFRKRAEPSKTYNRELLGRMLAGYEAEVYYVDREFGRLLDAWDKRPTGPNSLVVVTSDHGEGLGEHSYQGHGFLLYDEQVRVPLILRLNGRVNAGTRVDAVSSAVDFGATLLELAGIGDLPGFRGRSLFSDSGRLTRSKPVFAERRFFTEMDLERSDALRKLTNTYAERAIGSIGEKCVLIDDGWKFIWNESGRHELYHLVEDSREAANVIAKQAARAAEMLAEIEVWRKRESRTQADEEPADSETESMLDALGY